MAKGYIKIHRKALTSELWVLRPSIWFKIWIYILFSMNYEDNQLFKRGENFMKYDIIMEETGATYGQIDKFIRWAKKRQMLSTRKTTRGMVVKVLNYNKYQDRKVPQSTPQSKHSRNTVDTISKKERKKEEYTLLSLEKFITLWNSHAKYKGTTKVLNISVRNKLLPECRKVTPDIKREWLKLEKLGYGQEDYIIAVDNYVREICLRSPKNDYARHRFSCYEFIKQQNGFKKFVNR